MSKDFGQHTEVDLMQDLDRLGAYVEGRLSEEEMAKAEMDIAQDPLLQDMIQGLQALENPEEIRDRIQQMRLRHQPRLLEQVKKRTQLSKRKFRVQPKRYLQLSMGLAAGLALTLLSIYLIYKLPPSRPTSDALASHELPATQLSPSTPMTPPMVLPDSDVVESGVTSEKPDVSSHPTPGLNSKREDAFSDEVFVQAPHKGNVQRAPTPTVEPSTPTSPKHTPNSQPSLSAPTEEDLSSVVATDPYLAGNAHDKAMDQARPIEEASDPMNTERLYDDAIPDGEISITAEDAAVSPLTQDVDFGYYKESKIKKDTIFSTSSGIVYAGLLAEGKAAYEDQNYALARERLEEILFTNQDHVLAHHYLGLISFHEEDFKAAVGHFKYVSSASSEFMESQLYMAQSYVGLGKKAKAKKVLEQMLSKQAMEGQERFQDSAATLLENL
ncbi:MAG: hypothetical protein AAFR59_07070 [Bacteroidota bacterium]